jgi:hypothetical protein
MKTKAQLKKHAKVLSKGFFYADDNQAWEPFEDWSKDKLKYEVENLAENIYQAMLWAQNDNKGV